MKTKHLFIPLLIGLISCSLLPMSAQGKQVGITTSFQEEDPFPSGDESPFEEEDDSPFEEDDDSPFEEEEGEGQILGPFEEEDPADDTDIPKLPTSDRTTEDDLPERFDTCLLYTSPSPRDKRQSRMPSSA